jgi:hypothetical protein
LSKGSGQICHSQLRNAYSMHHSYRHNYLLYSCIDYCIHATLLLVFTRLAAKMRQHVILCLLPSPKSTIPISGIFAVAST